MEGEGEEGREEGGEEGWRLNKGRAERCVGKMLDLRKG